MNITKLMLISLSLAVDAFAIALCKGINTKEYNFRKGLKVGFFFGVFQALMPLIGYALGNSVRDFFDFIGHYVVFFFLVLIGVSMLYDAFCGEDKKMFDDYSFITLTLLAIATSIDAFSVGITFVFLDVNLILAVSLIGIVAFILSYFGVFIGNKFGRDDSKKAKIIGGIILIALAIELLAEHLF